MVTAPLTADTQGLLDTTMLARCRDGCNVVNIGRAEIVDEHAMWCEVSSGRLGFAADVWWHEPVPGAAAPRQPEPFYGSEYPFHELDNVVVTPHYGGAIGLDGIEEERADAVVQTAHAALFEGLRPVDLSLGY